MMLDSCKMVEKQSEAFHTFLRHFFPILKQNFIAYRSSKVSSRPDCIFEIHQLWQSGFSKVYSNSCFCCSFEAGQSSHKMDSNYIQNFQESSTILNACTKKSENLLKVRYICLKDSPIHQQSLRCLISEPSNNFTNEMDSCIKVGEVPVYISKLSKLVSCLALKQSSLSTLPHRPKIVMIQ